MSDERPKLFANKPKKSKLKASKPITTVPPPSKEAAAPPPPPPPPLPKKEPFFQRFRLPLPPALERFRFLVPFVLVINFTIGAYTLVRVTMNKKERSEEDIPDHSAHSTTNAAAPIPTTPAAAAAITEMPVVLPIMEPIQRAPIPEDQRRELFKWMLEERRKMKPKNAEEKKRIDEEKAILKQFIGAKSLPL